jgi:hypothetical protein
MINGRELLQSFDLASNPHAQHLLARITDKGKDGEDDFNEQGVWQLALIGFQGRGRDEVVQSDFYHDLFLKALPFQWPYK